jgi:hypothetical protein
MIPQAIWFISDLAFQINLRVLPLTAYDLIISMDWLKLYNPMKVHWRHKWMKIPYGEQMVTLQGAIPTLLEHVLMQLCVLSAQGSFTSDIKLFPEEIQSLLHQSKVLFEEPSRLPPSRTCDHAIPLIPGARTISIRQYHYPPVLKTEIENQVAEMLQKGLIQPSARLFSSLVLLTKKKDGSYRFCVDFRHLNALTLKSKFPVPVFNS